MISSIAVLFKIERRHTIWLVIESHVRPRAQAHEAGIPMETILWEEAGVGVGAGTGREARTRCRAASLAACAQLVADDAHVHAREVSPAASRPGSKQ